MPYWDPNNLTEHLFMWLPIEDVNTNALSATNQATTGPIQGLLGEQNQFGDNSPADAPDVEAFGSGVTLLFEDGDDFFTNDDNTASLGTNRYIQTFSKCESQVGLLNTVLALESTDCVIRYSSQNKAGNRTINAKAGAFSSANLGTVVGDSTNIIAIEVNEEASDDALEEHRYFLNTQVAATTEDESAVTFDLEGQIFLGSDAGSADSLNDFAGSIGDVVVLDFLPSESQRKRLEGWIAHTYGVVGRTGILPTDHEYRNDRPIAQFISNKFGDGLSQMLQGDINDGLNTSLTFN